jgi:DNA (cytosine-5)-methyltransferase 1
MRTRLAASAQVASVALPAITRSAMARKRKFDAALGSVSAKQLTAVSLFCGAGGMDVGFNRAAFKTIWAADKNSAACATYNRYAQQEIALRRDLAKEDFKELRQQLACTPDCVFGGPPCQCFSQAGKTKQTDARNDLLHVFLDAVEELRPRCFVMENVKNLNNGRRFRPLLDALVQRAEKLGYSCATEVVNCNDFDVPQARERLIFVGFLPGGRLRHPSKYFFRVLRRYSKRAQASGEVLSTLGRAGSETNPLGSTAKIVVTKNPVLRQSPYAGMLFNGKGRPIDPSWPCPALTASMGGHQTPIIDEKHFFDGEEG